MIDLIDDMRQQDAVYWPPQADAAGRAVTDDYGKIILGIPKDLKVYWQDKVEEVMTSQGDKKISQAVVYVGEDVSEGGVLWQGVLANVPPQYRGNPRKLYKAFEVMKFDKTSTLDFDQFLRRAYL